MRVRLLLPGNETDLIAAAREFNDLELSQARAAEILSDPTFVMVVAETDDGELMARIYGHELRRLEQTDLFLYEIDTVERHRRKGAGRKMLEFISTLCRSRGYGEWFVPTECDNVAGNGLYRAVGAVAEHSPANIYAVRMKDE
jgi:GNAT superfamily N-acetyltransferase